MFIDEVHLSMRAGKGGDGIISWRREKYIPKGGPYGGDGGDGGDIILRATTHETTLGKFRHQKVIKAEDGQKGGTQEMHGATAPDLIIEVPVGTLVTDAEDGTTICDLTKPHQEFVICEGGRGGFGNAHFPSSTRQAPNFAELGDSGDIREVKMELKLVADVGLVGLPNAGKSTVIQSLTNVKPKIADYAFTTLVPNLGVMEWKGHSLVIEDVPGLIEGASEGKGLGFQFLKHIDRCRIIIHLLDASQGEDAMIENYRVIRRELELWYNKKDDNSKIGARGEGTVGTKMTATGNDEQSEEEGVGLPLETFGTFGYKSTEHGIEKSSVAIAPAPLQKELPDELIVMSKADLIDPDQLEEMKKIFEKATGKKVALTISAGAYIRVDELKDLLIERIPSIKSIEEKNTVEDAEGNLLPDTPQVMHYDLKNTRKSDPKRCHITRREDGDYEVTGERIEEIARMTDTRYVDGVNRIYDVMEKLGVMRKLKLLISEELTRENSGFFEGEDDFKVPAVWISEKKFSLEGLVFMKEQE